MPRASLKSSAFDLTLRGANMAHTKGKCGRCGKRIVGTEVIFTYFGQKYVRTCPECFKLKLFNTVLSDTLAGMFKRRIRTAQA